MHIHVSCHDLLSQEYPRIHVMDTIVAIWNVLVR